MTSTTQRKKAFSYSHSNKMTLEIKEIPITFSGKNQETFDYEAPLGLRVSSYEPKLVKLHGGNVKIVSTDKSVSVVYNGESDGVLGFSTSRVMGTLIVVLEEDKPDEVEKPVEKNTKRVSSRFFGPALKMICFMVVICGSFRSGFKIGDVKIGVVHSEVVPFKFSGHKKLSLKYKVNPLYSVLVEDQDIKVSEGGEVTFEFYKDELAEGVLIHYTGTNGFFRKESRAEGQMVMRMIPKPLHLVAKGKCMAFTRNIIVERFFSV